jgi:acetylornithine deacetylase/succinyl-diaminopimelate desuccinylase-like protein
MRRAAIGVAMAAVLACVVQAQAQRTVGVEALMQNAATRAAVDGAKGLERQVIEDQIRFCEVPAPSFKETARGEVLKRTFQDLGLQNVRIDAAGNVLGDRPGAGPHPHLVMAAHLDTVFPEGTDVTVRREGAVLHGPGIGDDCRGLAVLVAIVRALDHAGVHTPGTITFVADVGEEGLGDLRGMKQLFDNTLKGEVDRFVSIDGTGLGLTHQFVGSHRYRVTFKGPGGHSFGAFGLPSPIGAMGRAIAKIQELQVPAAPKTTFNVGRVGGGTSVNSIAGESWMEVDMRSVDKTSLLDLDARFHKIVDEAVQEENARWNRPGLITATKQQVGDRPVGVLPDDAPEVQTAIAVTNLFGHATVDRAASTDANYPLSLGIPSLAIGGGGAGRNAHSLSESFDTTNGYLGTQRATLLAIALAQR